MKQIVQAQILTVYCGQDDKYRTGLLYPAIVEHLKEAGIAGVSVIRGEEGFGAHQKLHTPRFEVTFSGLPVIIQAVDVPERIDAVLPVLDEMITEGLVTVQDVMAIRYNKDPQD